jgi:hypothetical protein
LFDVREEPAAIDLTVGVRAAHKNPARTNTLFGVLLLRIDRHHLRWPLELGNPIGVSNLIVVKS